MLTIIYIVNNQLRSIKSNQLIQIIATFKQLKLTNNNHQLLGYYIFPPFYLRKFIRIIFRIVFLAILSRLLITYGSFFP
jgi:hypothetical protein